MYQTTWTAGIWLQVYGNQWVTSWYMRETARPLTCDSRHITCYLSYHQSFVMLFVMSPVMSSIMSVVKKYGTLIARNLLSIMSSVKSPNPDLMSSNTSPSLWYQRHVACHLPYPLSWQLPRNMQHLEHGTCNQSCHMLCHRTQISFQATRFHHGDVIYMSPVICHVGCHVWRNTLSTELVVMSYTM